MLRTMWVVASGGRGGGDFNIKLEAGRQAQIRLSARDK